MSRFGETRKWTGLALAGALWAASAFTTSAVALPLDPINDLGLAPGETYHYLFVTDGVRDATSSNIADYNAFVNAEAVSGASVFAADGLNWSAVGSTNAVDARDNTVVSGKVFLPDGTLLALSFADFWDGSLSAAPNRSQSLAAFNINTGIVFSGSEADGTSASPDALGSISAATVGRSVNAGSGWIREGFVSTALSFHLYALSDAIIVPLTAGAPAPGSLVLAGMGLLLLAGRQRVRSGR
jgi:hypothetical protein